MIGIFYKDLFPWKSDVNFEAWLPYCEITVHSDAHAGGQIMWALVDSGAQFLMLPFEMAKRLEIDTASLPTEMVISAFGHSLLTPWTKLNVTINGERVRVVAFFGNFPTPLIGTETIKAAMSFGVDRQGWLGGPKPPQIFSMPTWLVQLFKLAEKAFGSRPL